MINYQATNLINFSYEKLNLFNGHKLSFNIITSYDEFTIINIFSVIIMSNT